MLRSNIRPPYEEGDDLILASRGRKYAGVCSRGKWQARSAAAMRHPFLLERTPALRDKSLARSPVLEAAGFAVRFMERATTPLLNLQSGR